MYIYAFGSLCRGEVFADSDIDLLAIVKGYKPQLDPNVFSIYSQRSIDRLWRRGNPFSWHLSLEARIIYAHDHRDYIAELGHPNPYRECLRDCTRFFALFKDAKSSIMRSRVTVVFDLSTVFLSIRNIAICFSLGVLRTPDFSRHSALHLGASSLAISESAYRILERSRILCTRGQGARLTVREVSTAVLPLGEIETWMEDLVRKAKSRGRI